MSNMRTTSYGQGQAPGARPARDKANRDAAAATSDLNPPLPYEDAPPLPDEPAPTPDATYDGWSCHTDSVTQAYYYYNSWTGEYTWENPRVPGATAQAYSQGPSNREPTSSAGIPTSSAAPGTSSPPRRKWGGYNPAIHGSYDHKADYALAAAKEEEEAEEAAAAAATAAAAAAASSYAAARGYAVQANFNKFTGKFQQPGVGPEMHNDENKSKRHLNAFFDVDAAANSHDGRSLKEERRNKPLSKKEVKAFQAIRRDKKEKKRRAFYKD